MGQGKSSPYLAMLRHLLKTHGVSVSFSDLEMCVEVIKKYSPWFPEEDTLDIDTWQRIQTNVEKAVRQGEKIPVWFWSMIFVVLKAMTEEQLVTDLGKGLLHL